MKGSEQQQLAARGFTPVGHTPYTRGRGETYIMTSLPQSDTHLVLRAEMPHGHRLRAVLLDVPAARAHGRPPHRRPFGGG